MTLDKIIKEHKEKLKKIIKDYEEELNKRDFGIIYDDIGGIYSTPTFTALLLKNNINPLIYMDEVPKYFACDLDIEKIVIPNNITRIGCRAFQNCSSLTSITIPESVVSIDDYAFWGCRNLTSIAIPDNIISINEYTFTFCSSLTSITIPDSVTSIDFFAFQGCENLKSITIPNNVTNIDYGAFRDCNSLTDVYYKGSEEDWNKIKIENDNNALLTANIHYNS